MNELFAADPAVCRSASELKLLLASFGPYTGRYLANYPNNWAATVEKQFLSAGDVETARVRNLLRRARESITLITRSNLSWNAELDWVSNAKPFVEVKPKIFNGLIAVDSDPPDIQVLPDMDLPPTADERLVGTAEEYVRASKILLLVSHEIILIDPFINPIKRDYFDVLLAMFKVLAKGKCIKIVLWARAKTVLGTGDQKIAMSDIDSRLRRIAKQALMETGRIIEMNFVDDETCQNKMHGRYLLSIKGGVRFDQGFQQLPADRRVEVGPIGKITHNDLWDIYVDGRHDMKVAGRVEIKV